MKPIDSSCVLCTLILSIPAPAQAYLDPGTGSIVFQVAMGGLLAALAAAKLYWKRICSLFRKGK